MNHFFDVGANIGQTFDTYLTKTNEFDGWTVWCFEPSPRHWSSLLAQAEKYGQRYKIIVCPFGLYGRNDTALLYPKKDPEGDSLFEELTVNRKYIDNLQIPYRLLVPIYRLTDIIIQRIPLEDRIVIKLDAEGAEYSILYDLIDDILALKRVVRLLVEWHEIPDNPYSKDLLMKEFAKEGKPLESWI